MVWKQNVSSHITRRVILALVLSIIAGVLPALAVILMPGDLPFASDYESRLRVVEILVLAQQIPILSLLVLAIVDHRKGIVTRDGLYLTIVFVAGLWFFDGLYVATAKGNLTKYTSLGDRHYHYALDSDDPSLLAEVFPRMSELAVKTSAAQRIKVRQRILDALASDEPLVQEAAIRAAIVPGIGIMPTAEGTKTVENAVKRYNAISDERQLMLRREADGHYQLDVLANQSPL